MGNKEIADVFYEMGNILDIKGESIFRINAYRRAAQVIDGLGKDLMDIYESDPEEIENLSGIGSTLKEKIVELLTTGKCEAHEEMKKGFPVGLLEMLKLRGVGPKKVKLFYSELGIETVIQLEDAAKSHVLRELDGMGEKSELDILQSIEESHKFSDKRHLINLALDEANEIIEYLKGLSEVFQIQYAGSLRRFKETIGDIDILVSLAEGGDSLKVMDFFVKFKKVYHVISKGNTKSSIVLLSGIQVDLRVVDNDSFGAALHYFTGNKQHNIRIRDIAKKKGLKVNEYGVFKGEKQIAGKTEEEVFKAVGLPYLPPEIRRNENEFEFAIKNKKAPDLVQLSDIRGDLHMHSTYSDGKKSIEEMANCCIEKGYQYMAITDHSKLLSVANGMSVEDLQKQGKEVDKLNAKFGNKFKIFKGCEVDILKDGSLDFSDEILKNLDLVIISSHYAYKEMDSTLRTKRIINAIENKYTRILAHPTGRKFGIRPEMELDMEKIIKACKDNNVYLEINSNPIRLDLAEKHLLIAKEIGAKIVINSDAHNCDQLDFLKFGVGMARRGWCSKNDVINTFSVEEIDNCF